mgnify:CR=1 FL=1
MTIYIVLLAIAILLCVFRNYYYYSEKQIAIIFLVVLAFLGFYRGITVGTDNLVYSMNFKFTNFDPNTWSAYTEFEPGFNFLIALFRRFISNNYLLFMGLMYVCWILAFYKLMVIFNEGYIYPIFIALCLGWLTTTPYNIMRQTFALSLYAFVLPLLLNGRKCLYVLMCFVIGFLFHRSVIVLAILGVVDNKYILKLILNKKLVILILALSYIFVFLKQPLVGFLNNHLSIFQFLGDRYIGYISHSEYEEESISKLSALLNTFMACLAVYSLDKKHRFYSIYVLFILCGTVFNNFLGSVFVIFMRVATNFTWIFIFCYSATLHHTKGLRGLILNNTIVFYCLLIYIKSLIKNFGDIVPYVNRLFS